ncbi:MAG TPA: DUF58 domain-containing protein [Thermoanaerobaculia bacterium]|nr:DUF58 domain-containing protein [Thermoanaerobaculia bacterium]
MEKPPPRSNVNGIALADRAPAASDRFRARHRPGRRPVPEGIRPTKVGIWFVALTLLLGIAATNTGNNALYMVVALMLATLIVSGVLSRNDVRRVDVELTPPEEVFADSPAAFQVEITNRGRVLPRWLLLISFSDQASTLLCSSLPRGGRRGAVIELAFPRRGLHRIGAAHLATLFPLGLFRKGMRQRLDREVLVFPRLVAGRHLVRRSTTAIGETQDRRAGWGHDLHSLRALRTGDDPRRIHWKQTARTGKLIFMERQAERSRRITVVVDNALDPAQGAAGEDRLEQRISEAAAAVLAYLAAGFEVELVTRSERIDFGGGQRQRRRILETLALLPPAPAADEPLARGSGLEERFETASMGAA